MIISYNINKINYKATFCNNKESPDIYKALSKLYCDKKLLLIIDKKLNAKFTKFLFKDLKLFQEDFPACHAIYRSGTITTISPFFLIK